ncbi:MAG: hypothetical protein AAES65_02805 [Candidatus Thiodiazotropha sp. (ex. Lucinoma kazani)]
MSPPTLTVAGTRFIWVPTIEVAHYLKILGELFYVRCPKIKPIRQTDKPLEDA